MLDLSSNYCYHMRITGSYEVCRSVLKAFNAHYPTMKIVAGFEVSKQGVEHCHAHIEMTQKDYLYHTLPAGKQWRSTFFQKVGLSKLYNFQKLEKTPGHNIRYCLKDNDIIYRSLNMDDIETGQQLEEVKQQIEEVQKSMKQDTRHKLLELFNEYMKKLKDDKDQYLSKRPEWRNSHQLFFIARFIHNLYINEWDKEPPLNHMKGYVMYIAEKNDHIDYSEQLEQYYYKLF